MLIKISVRIKNSKIKNTVKINTSEKKLPQKVMPII